MNKKLIAENELCCIFNDGTCEMLTDYCERYFNNFPQLKNHKVFICEEKKNGHKMYVLFNESNEPIEEDCALDGMAIKIEKLRYLKNLGENK